MPKMTRNVLRIDPAARGPVMFAIYSTGAIVIVSFVLSFAALSTLSGWMALPAFLGPLLPIFIDGAIIVYTYAAIAASAEGESAVRPWLWVGLWTTVSSGANAAHAWLNGPQGFEGVVGAVLAGLIPVGSLLGTHEIARRIMIRPERDFSLALDTAPVQRRRPSKASKVDTSKAPAVDAGASTRQLPAPSTVDRPAGSGKISTASTMDAVDIEARDLQIVQWYTDKVSIPEICKRTGLSSRQSVYNVLDKAGVRR